MAGKIRQQFLPSIQRVGNFTPVGNCILLPCTTTSGSSQVALPTLPTGSTASDILIWNSGSVGAFVVFAKEDGVDAAIPTAGNPANGMPLAPGVEMVIDKGQAQYVAGITSTSTADVYMIQGIGS